jgi:hypothetical protein
MIIILDIYINIVTDKQYEKIYYLSNSILLILLLQNLVIFKIQIIYFLYIYIFNEYGCF